MIDLRQFCGGEMARYAIAEPWNVGGWTVATDRVWLIGVKTDEPDTIDGKKRPKVMTLLLPVIDYSGEWHDMPQAGACGCCKIVDGATCPACNGKQTVECDYCDGSGTVACYHCGADTECDECDGDGEIGCETCDGEGVMRASKWNVDDCRCAVKLGDRYFRGARFDEVAKLPNVRWAEVNDSVMLKFDGGVGTLMALGNIDQGTLIREISQTEGK